MMHPFEILADPVRRRIVEVLAVGEHTAGELADAVGHEFAVTGSAISHQLRTLRDNGVVLVVSDLSSRIYRLNPDALDRLDEAVAALFDLWDLRYGSRYRRDPLRPPERQERRTHRARSEGYRSRRRADPDDAQADQADDPWAGLPW
jgi:DNA-binding transcriptional ArsR family regulator